MNAHLNGAMHLLPDPRYIIHTSIVLKAAKVKKMKWSKKKKYSHAQCTVHTTSSIITLCQYSVLILFLFLFCCVFFFINFNSEKKKTCIRETRIWPNLCAQFLLDFATTAARCWEKKRELHFIRQRKQRFFILFFLWLIFCFFFVLAWMNLIDLNKEKMKKKRSFQS